MNIWHDINPKWISPDNFTVCIEISKGGKAKYELDKETGRLRLDRILYTSTHYPENYGFIPRTYGEDMDPLDVLVMCSETIVPMSLVQCRPIGFFNMIDGGRNDEKIIAVPLSDPLYNGYRSIKELPEHKFVEMQHFFSIYKTLEGKETSVLAVQEAELAVEAIKKAMARYDEYFGKAAEHGD